jgi:DNA polymerase III subunit alpha
MYVNLASRSDYSFMEGVSKVKHMVKRMGDLGGQAMALTDRCTMSGAYEFSKVAKEAGILPIIGVQLPILFGEGRGRRKGFLTFLAQNDVGYRNICRLMNETLRPEQGKNSHDALDRSLLRSHSEGVIVLSGGIDGALSQMILSDRTDWAKELVDELQGIFGDRFYIQINRNHAGLTADQARVEKQLLKFAQDSSYKLIRDNETVFTGIPLVATAEACYATEDRHDAFELLAAVEAGRKADVSNGDLVLKHDERFHLRSQEEMEALFPDLPHAIENTTLLADRCAFMVVDRKPILPAFETEGGRSEIEELRAQSIEGLEGRLARKPGLTDAERQEYFDRLDYELKVIGDMGFPGYFLIVSDFIKWAKRHDIPVGPGRGSGAGSMVAWALLITDLDPFQYGLLFERFLNPDRVSMPDFDIDICQTRRDEVIDYVAKKYGRDEVAQIITFMVIKSKTAIKDTGRVLSDMQHGTYGFGELDALSKLIPNKDGAAEAMDLEEAYDNAPEFRVEIERSAKSRALYDQSRKIEGLYRNSGAHAAGVIIGDRPLVDLIPITWDKKSGAPLTQYNMKGAEGVGLVKFDFLGLKTLSVIKMALDLIKESRGQEVDISEIPLDDASVYEMLQGGYSNGVFQFESAGMQKVLKQVKPTRIEDLIAVNALYRPGPMDQIDHYAACKNGTAEPHYPAPVDRTKPFLEETFGIMVYQEQVMRVAQEFAGYTLGGADLLRRAMGKKIAAEMDKQRKIFVEGGVARGSSEVDAHQLFDTIAKFAGYGFNKSHAAAYAYIAYQTAWLKKHYTAEFFSALLSFETHKPERMALIREDMSYFDIEMLPPSINNSFPLFRPEACDVSKGGFGIRFGLTAIKGVSGALVEFLAERAKRPFSDLKDFAQRNDKFFNKSLLTKLSAAGTFDEFDRNRARATALLDYHSKGKAAKGQVSMFDDAIEEKIPASILELKDWGNRLDREFAAVGFYFNVHPIDHFLPKLAHKHVRTLADQKERMEEQGLAELQDRLVCAMIDKCFLKTSARSGKQYISLQCSEKNGSFSALYFPRKGRPSLKVIEERARMANINRIPVILQADISLRGDRQDLDIFASDVLAIEDFLSDVRGDLRITVEIDEIQELPETAARRIKATDDLAEGAITKAQYDKVMHEAMIKKVQVRIGSLHGYFASIQAKEKDEDDPDAVQLHLILRHGGEVKESRMLAGKYIVTPSVENRLKAMDGVVSVFEAAPSEDMIDEDDVAPMTPGHSSAPSGPEAPPTRSRLPRHVATVEDLEAAGRYVAGEAPLGTSVPTVTRRRRLGEDSAAHGGASVELEVADDPEAPVGSAALPVGRARRRFVSSDSSDASMDLAADFPGTADPDAPPGEAAPRPAVRSRRVLVAAGGDMDDLAGPIASGAPANPDSEPAVEASASTPAPSPAPKAAPAPAAPAPAPEPRPAPAPGAVPPARRRVPLSERGK